MYSLKEKVHTDSLTVILVIIGDLDESGDDKDVKSDDSRQENAVTGLNRLLLWLLV